MDRVIEALRVDVSGPVARLTLDRPSSGNALDLATAEAFLETVIACDENEAIRCVVLTGAGRIFCAGGDVGAFASAGEALPAYLKRLTSAVHSAITRLAHMNKPLVTAVNGTAAGVGFSLAILGDIVIAAKSASFTLAYTRIGLTPDGGSTWLLPRLVGLRRAQEIAITNKRIAADEAVQMGLVTRVVADEDLEGEVERTAAELASAATQAIGATRNLLMAATVSEFEAQLERESRSIAAAARTSHGREGIAAFLAKRPPKFD
jgi:2-(1,2-epoxy-1,2-dihydrophenyl)acetyl-CoA isomerase